MKPRTTLLLLISMTIACSPINLGSSTIDQDASFTLAASMTDGFNTDIFSGTGGSRPPLSSPYVEGTDIEIFLTPSTGQSFAGWTVKSSDPGVIEVSSPLHASMQSAESCNNVDGGMSCGQTSSAVIAATLKAVRAGSANLSLLDGSGNTVDTEPVSVKTPTAIKLYAPGIVLTTGGAAAEVSQVNVIAASKAAFLVRYFAGSTELAGSGVLNATGSGDVTATTTSLSYSPSRDFLYVSPAVAGPAAMVTLGVGITALGSLAVSGVPADTVTKVNLLAGEALFLYARATDAMSADVFGAPFAWEVNGKSPGFAQGEPTQDPADLLIVEQSGTSAKALSVTVSDGTLSSSASIQGTLLFAGSTLDLPVFDNPPSCSLAGRPGMGTRLPGVPSLALSVAFGLIALARRRALAERGVRD